MKTFLNGKEITIENGILEQNLLEWLREAQDLTGAKNGCGIGVCGACTVLIENQPIRSCILKVRDILDKQVLTIEGMEYSNRNLHPLQQAFMSAGAIQCGFCTPGMVLTAHAFLLQNPKPTRQQARAAMKGNLCRCTGYQQIIDAIILAAEHYRRKT